MVKYQLFLFCSLFLWILRPGGANQTVRPVFFRLHQNTNVDYNIFQRFRQAIINSLCKNVKENQYVRVQGKYFEGG